MKHLERTPGKPPLRSLKEIPPRVLGAENPALTPTEKLRTVRMIARTEAWTGVKGLLLPGISPWYLASGYALPGIGVLLRVASPPS